MRILFVCTGNLCRSPMAAALLARHPEVSATGASVSSAGLVAGGRPVPPEVEEALAPFGVDVSGHRSRTLTAQLVADADLVVGMGRRHVHEAVLADPGAWGRTFRIGELDQRAQTVGPRRAGEDGPAWVARVHDGRTRRDLVRWAPDDDVDDPYGGPLSGYVDAAGQLAALTDRLAGLLVPAGAGPIGGR